MKKTGYVYSLLVFLIFAAVFVVAVASLKSASVVQNTDYDATTITKASNMCGEVKYLLKNGADCSEIESEITSTDLPFNSEFNCGGNPLVFRISSLSGRYVCNSSVWIPPFCSDDGIQQPEEICDSGYNGICTHGCDMSAPDACTCNTYCGDGWRQNPNDEGLGGPDDNGYEACDGTDGCNKLGDVCDSDCICLNGDDKDRQCAYYCIADAGSYGNGACLPASQCGPTYGGTVESGGSKICNKGGGQGDPGACCCFGSS